MSAAIVPKHSLRQGTKASCSIAYSVHYNHGGRCKPTIAIEPNLMASR